MTHKNQNLVVRFMIVFIHVIIILTFTGCSQPAAQPTETPLPPEPKMEEAEHIQEVNTDTPEPTQTPQSPTETPTQLPPPETPTPEFTATPEIVLSGLSADPQRVEFQAEDGKNLVGYYYPSKFNGAPVIVLMHWAVGNQLDWCVIAPWLQNQQDEEPAKVTGCTQAPENFQFGGSTPWWDPSWFPPMPEEASFAVFTFDFRDYGESEHGMVNSKELTLDAKAAFETAAGLEGVDATRMVSKGASIGSDGAQDGCYLFNQDSGGGCLGAFSLSPSSYLEMVYADVVTSLDTSEPPIPVWCLAAELDYNSPVTCNSASGDVYRVQIYEGKSEHGMKLVDPVIEPNPLVLFLEFLSLIITW